MSFNKTNIIQKRENAFEVPKKGSSIPLNVKNRIRNDKQNKLKANIPRMTPGSLSKNRKLHNCLVIEEDITPVKSGPLYKLKSHSMVELNSTPKPAVKKSKSKEQGDECGILSISESRELDVSFPLNKDEAALANNAYYKFVLNAWRKRRLQMAVFESIISEYKKQVENQTVQIVVLRDMFESEKLRVAVAMGDSAHLKDRLERELKINDQLKEEITSLRNEKVQWENNQTRFEFEISRLNSELRSTNEKMSYLEIDRDRYKNDLEQSHATEAELLNKIGRNESQLKGKLSIIQDMREKSTNLQSQMTQLLLKNKSLGDANKNKQKEINDCISRNAKISEELNNIKNSYKTQSENIANLTKDLEIATDKLEMQNRLIGDLENVADHYEQEKQQFKDTIKATRNQIIFEAIKATAKLFFPVQNDRLR